MKSADLTAREKVRRDRFLLRKKVQEKIKVKMKLEHEIVA